jgi:ubiquinone biosynthesis protein COQ9
MLLRRATAFRRLAAGVSEGGLVRAWRARYVRRQATASAGAAGASDSGEDPRERILAAALAHVGTLGWTREALSAGAEDLAFPPSAHGLFPNGAMDLVGYVVQQADRAVGARFAELDEAGRLADMRANDRVREGVAARLRSLAPYVESGAWARAMAVGLLPHNVPLVAQQVASSADEIWYQAGDVSTDMSWYSRRGLLAGILVACELHMLTDKSVAFADTLAFLDRRLDDVSRVGGGAADTLAVLGSSATGLLALLGGVDAVARPFLELQKGAGLSSVADSLADLVRRAATLASEHAVPKAPPRAP